MKGFILACYFGGKMTENIFAGLPYYRFLLVAVSRHYDTDAVIDELIKVGWDQDAYKLTPEVVERSVKEMVNLVLHGVFYPTGNE